MNRIIVKVAQETGSVTLRSLPEGVEARGTLERRQQAPLHVAVGAGGMAAEFRVGSAVEIQCDQMLYLGEVVGVQGSAVVVEVKHALNRAALAVIQEVWQETPGLRRPS